MANEPRKRTGKIKLSRIGPIRVGNFLDEDTSAPGDNYELIWRDFVKQRSDWFLKMRDKAIREERYVRQGLATRGHEMTIELLERLDVYSAHVERLRAAGNEHDWEKRAVGFPTAFWMAMDMFDLGMFEMMVWGSAYEPIISSSKSTDEKRRAATRVQRQAANARYRMIALEFEDRIRANSSKGKKLSANAIKKSVAQKFHCSVPTVNRAIRRYAPKKLDHV